MFVNQNFGATYTSTSHLLLDHTGQVSLSGLHIIELSPALTYQNMRSLMVTFHSPIGLPVTSGHITCPRLFMELKANIPTLRSFGNSVTVLSQLCAWNKLCFCAQYVPLIWLEPNGLDDHFFFTLNKFIWTALPLRLYWLTISEHSSLPP